MATNENAAEVVSRFSDPVFFGTPTEGGPRVPPTPGPSGDNASTPGPSGDAKHLLQAPKAATPTSLMLAIFKDSVEAEIPGFTFKEWQQRQETNKGTKLRKAPSMREGRQKTKGKLRIAPSLWEGRQKTSGTKLRITMKKDRGQLMILKEDSKQICQIKIKNCGKDHDKGSEIALRIMTAVGEAYASDKVARDMLRKMRDEKLAELVPSSNLLKKTKQAAAKPSKAKPAPAAAKPAPAAAPEPAPAKKRPSAAHEPAKAPTPATSQTEDAAPATPKAKPRGKKFRGLVDPLADVLPPPKAGFEELADVRLVLKF